MAEWEDRAKRRAARRSYDAGFTRRKRTEEFDLDASNAINPSDRSSARPAPGSTPAPICLIGASDAAKSRLQIGLGTAATRSRLHPKTRIDRMEALHSATGIFNEITRFASSSVAVPAVGCWSAAAPSASLR